MPRRGWYRLAISLAFGIVAAIGGMRVVPSALAQTAATENQETPEIYDFSLDDSSRMTVAVNIGAAGPYPFIVDTGATRSVIAKELAEQLNLPAGPATKVHSMSEAKVARTVIVPSLKVNGRTVKSFAAPALSAQNLHAAGVLGLDALKSQNVVIDFAAERMSVTASFDQLENWSGDRIVVTAKSRLGQLILTDASIDDEHVYVIIDTGGEVSLGNEALRRKLFGANATRKWTKIELLDVMGGVTQADYTRVDRLRIGGVRLTGVPIAFADAHPFEALDLTREPAVLLGMDALQLFDRVSLDFAKKKVAFLWAKKAAP